MSISFWVMVDSAVRAGAPNSFAKRALVMVRPVAVVEVVHVEAKGAVVLQVEQLIEDQVDVFRLAVGGQPHQLVLAGVDPEAGVIGKGRVQQAQRVREVELPLRGRACCRRRATPRWWPIRRRRRGTSRRPSQRGWGRTPRRRGTGGARQTAGWATRFIATTELAELALQRGLQVELLLQPDRHGRDEGAEAARRVGQVGLQQALELHQRLVVEHDLVDVCQREAGLCQAASRWPARESARRASCARSALPAPPRPRHRPAPARPHCRGNRLRVPVCSSCCVSGPGGGEADARCSGCRSVVVFDQPVINLSEING